MTFPVFPSEASTTAARVDHLYFCLIAMSVVVLLIIFGPMFVFLFRYRRGHRAKRTAIRVSTWRIEVMWTVIPLLFTMGLFAWGARVYFDAEVPPPGTLEINVVGKQWMWKIQHQEGNREIDELHIPVGRPVKLTLASEDVIHSFFVPAFRMKQDVVPGRFTTEWFTATQIGDFHIFCSQYCGTSHSMMTGTVHVMAPAQYAAWLRTGATGDTLAGSGRALFRTLGCSGCHEGNSVVRAPRLEGLYGTLVPLANGQVVHADDKYIRDCILLPESQRIGGYPPLMPSFRGRISEEDLFQLIAYIKSLGSQQPLEQSSN
jgi:cytochrome c oxidase subunit II